MEEKLIQIFKSNHNKIDILNQVDEYIKKHYIPKPKPIRIDTHKVIEHKENTKANQALFNENEKVFRGQCKIVMDALNRGEQLTVATAMQEYGIGDLRRRIKDLKDTYGVKNIASVFLNNNRTKTWYLKNNDNG